MKRALFVAVPFVLYGCASAHPQEFDVGPSSGPPQAAAFDLTGAWDYNPSASDQPSQAGGVRGGYGGGGGGRGGFGGGFGGRGGFGGGGRGGEGGERGGGGGREGGRGGERDSTLMRVPGRLVIAQTDSSLSVDPRYGPAYTLFFDGRDVIVTDTTGASAGAAPRTWHLAAHWTRKRFEVTRELPGGRIMKESYELTSHGTRLVVHLTFAGGDSEQVMPEIRRVYDRER